MGAMETSQMRASKLSPISENSGVAFNATLARTLVGRLKAEPYRWVLRHVPCDERLEIQILTDATRPASLHIYGHVFLAQPDMQAAVA